MSTKRYIAQLAAVISVAALIGGAFAGNAEAAANRVVRVENQTNTNLLHIYAAGREYTTYKDWLGREVLSPNEYMDINFDDGTHDCNLAVVAKFADGEIVKKENFNVCTESRMVFTGD
jgi:hypothetical protein